MSGRVSEPEITWDLIRRRNVVERLKQEKGGLDVIHDLPAMIETGYEAVPEEDFVRIQWYGLYHDKPKLGDFMMRVKIPGGVLTPAELRTIGELSIRFGREHGELTTRQNIQLHWLELASSPRSSHPRRRRADHRRRPAATTCATSPAARFPASTATSCSTRGRCSTRPPTSSSSNREYSDLPRKHKITISACPHQCNAPEIHCIALRRVRCRTGGRLRRAGRRRALDLAAARGRSRGVGAGGGGGARCSGRSWTSGGRT